MRSYFLPFSVAILVCFVISIGDSQAQSKRKNKNEKPAPSVQKEIRWDYTIEGGEPTSKYKSSETVYSPKGLKKSWVNYTEEGDIRYEYWFKYNEQSRELKCIWVAPTGETITDYVEMYDAEGLPKQLTRFKPTGEKLDIVIYQHDTKGRKIFENYYGEGGRHIYSISYIYDDFRQIMTEKHKDLVNKTEFESGVRLDDTGNFVLRERYQQSGPLVDKVEYKRDKEGRLIQKNVYKDGKTLNLKEVYSYNNKENKMSCSVYTKGGEKLVEYFEYVYTYYE